MNLAQALAAAHALGLDRLDAQLLLLHALGKTDAARGWLLAHDTDTLPEPTQHAFVQLAQRRATGEPVAYLTGRKEFYGLTLQVDPRVLVPRPDTETLVDWTLEVLGGALGGGPDVQVLDLGTGSGAIALALKAQRPHWQMAAVDASADALAVAQANATRLHLDVAFSQGNWLNHLRPAQTRWHAIVSNPPYIEDHDPHLPALAHEPIQALTSGSDGLDDLRAIITQAPAHLQPGGWLLLEHGYNQAPAVRAMLEQTGFEQVQSRRDLAGIERCSGGQTRAAGAATASVK